MPSFLKDLSIRRRSKNSSKTNDTNGDTGGSSGTSSNDGENENNDRVQNKSSSTLNSWLGKSSPATTLSSTKSKSSSHLPSLNRSWTKTPPVPGTEARPRIHSSHSKRYSLVGMPSKNGEAVPRPTPATSPHAPKVLSVSDGSWVRCQQLEIGFVSRN